MSVATTATPIDYAREPATGGWMTQTVALFVDAYRELNAKKLFWITLILSLLVVAAFAFVSINDRGIKVFGAQFDNVGWSTRFIPKATFYKVLFTSIAIPWWLGLIATVLALLSVCGVFPDFISGGSIDLYLSKPIGRLRLFLTKYITSLLFVALQVFVFAFASFLLIGLRSGSWELGIFLAVPLVTLFFSYLFCVCVLVGVMTRSAMASLIVTILFWLLVFAANSADAMLLMFKSSADQRVEDTRLIMEANERIINQNLAFPGGGNAKAFQQQQAERQKSLPEFEKTARDLRYWYRLVSSIRAPLPKTGETVQLMNRWLIEPEPIMKAQEASRARREERRAERGRPPRNADSLDPEREGVAERMQEEFNGRTAAKLIGTSVGFEAVVLGIAAWLFCRRDF